MGEGMASNPISDTGAVLEAIQLGWAMAEVRARYYLLLGNLPATGGSLPTPPAGEGGVGPSNFIPLGRGERTGNELAIQARAVVGGLAVELDLDPDCAELSWRGSRKGLGSARAPGPRGRDRAGRRLASLQ